MCFIENGQTGDAAVKFIPAQWGKGVKEMQGRKSICYAYNFLYIYYKYFLIIFHLFLIILFVILI